VTCLHFALNRQHRTGSHIKVDLGLVGELHLLNAEDGLEDGVVDVGQVSLGGALSDSTELVIDGTVAKAHPALVGTDIGSRDATEMGANSGGDIDLGVTAVVQLGERLLIKSGGLGKSIRLIDLGLGQSSDEDELTVPGSLQDFTGRKFSNIDFLVSISDVTSSSDHLVVDDGDDGLDTKSVTGQDETLKHVDLGSLDLIISVFLVPQSVLIEPVVSLGLGIERIAEVRRARGGDPVSGPVRGEDVVSKLLRFAVVVVLKDAEVSLRGEKERSAAELGVLHGHLESSSHVLHQHF
jgi:hypothetical protein